MFIFNLMTSIISFCLEISGGPNPASDDLSPDSGNVTLPVGRSSMQFRILIKDDQVATKPCHGLK